MPHHFERYEVDSYAYHQEALTKPCFVCSIVARRPDHPAYIVYEDAHTIAFLDKHPKFFGYTLVAPREHRTQIISDFSRDAYLALQQRVYDVAEAVQQEVGAARMYLLCLGRNHGDAHVHWHVAPLPPDVPYMEQGIAVYRNSVVLNIPAAEQATLAARLRQRLGYVGEDEPASST